MKAQKNVEFIKVTCGTDTTAVITNKGTIYACGKNNFNKLGSSQSFLSSFLFKVTNFILIKTFLITTFNIFLIIKRSNSLIVDLK